MMPSRVFQRAATTWASSYLGCSVFVLADLAMREGHVSIALLGQLLWLALLGSVPTALVLGAAWWAANQGRALSTASTVVLGALVILVAWDHTDFLLSGPQWIAHPQRTALRVAMAPLLTLPAVAGWGWLILGYRIQRRLHGAMWLAVTVAAVILCSFAIVRYRAYDYSMAQLVFPAGLLCGAMVHLIVRESQSWPLVLAGATACLLFALGSRADRGLVTTGQRELIARSRAGALATVYILPRLGREEIPSTNGEDCPELRPTLEETPIGIDPSARRNVIVITVDAVRMDIVGTTVNGRGVTPELSRLAGSGVWFENATTTYPATLFAVGSAFTGLTPAELYLSPALPETIFTRSRAHVDRQIAVLPDVGWFRLPIVAEFLAPGIKADFAPTDTDATRALIGRLREARAEGDSVMAWIHYYSPHDPYQAHPSLPMGRGKKNAYLSEVAYFDRELGRLMRYLAATGWLTDTLVVFFSDHGEAVGEKSYWGHHVYLNGWMIDVPLVLWHQDLTPQHRQVGVSVADVAPTVLHFLGLPIPDVLAQSLFTLDADLRDRPSFAEAFPVRGRELFDSFRLHALDDASIHERLHQIRVASKGYEPKVAITQGRHRLIHHRGANTALFFDRDLDPMERRDLTARDPEAEKLLRATLERWEHDQLQRIRCRLQLTAQQDARPRPE